MKLVRNLLIMILFFLFISCGLSNQICPEPPCVIIDPPAFDIAPLYIAVKRGDKEEIERRVPLRFQRITNKKTSPFK